MRSLLVGVLIAVATTGCSFAGSTPLRASGAREQPRLTRAAFVARVETVCARRARALAALPRPRAKADRRAFFVRVATIEHTEANTLISLNPPRRLEREFIDLVAASAVLADTADRFAVAVVRDDAHSRRRALADAERASAQYDRAARRLRLKCRQSA